THSSNSDANASWAKLDDVLVDSFSVVADLNDDTIVRVFKTHPGFLSARVAKYIGERFLDDAENRGFHLWPKSRETPRLLDIHGSADATTLGKAVKKLFERGA